MQKASDSTHDTPESFTISLDKLAEHTFDGKITVAEIEDVLQGRGFATVCLVLSIPFVQPIPLPGLSVILGFAVIALGTRLTLGQSGGLPNFVRRREVDPLMLTKLIASARKIFSYVERFLGKRFDLMFRTPFLSLIGISIVASGLALSLPLPPVILFSNSLPAWSIIALCLGYLERDGLVVAVGHILAIATWIYFAFWWEALVYVFQAIVEFFT